jgi:hypothetical protein
MAFIAFFDETLHNAPSTIFNKNHPSMKNLVRVGHFQEVFA